MASRKFDQKEFLEEDIPYRLGTLDLFFHACRVVLSVPTPKQVRIIFDSGHEIRGPLPVYTNACIENGILSCRALMDFLNGQEEQPGKKRNRRKDDVFIDHFKLADGKSLPLVTLVEIAAFHPSNMSTDETLQALNFTRNTASKGVAHLTLWIHGEPEAEKYFQASCYAIRAAVESRLYGKLGMKAPPRAVRDVKRT